MEAALLLFLIIIGNLALYWVLYGRKKFEQQFQPLEDKAKRDLNKPTKIIKLNKIQQGERSDKCQKSSWS